MFSLHAACAVMDSYNLGDNAVITILRALKETGKIRDGYVLQSDLDKLIREHQL